MVKRIFITKSTKFRGKKFISLKIKKSVISNTDSKNTPQLNLKVIKGDLVIETSFATKK